MMRRLLKVALERFVDGGDLICPPPAVVATKPTTQRRRRPQLRARSSL
jgi:hypothetical protein